MNQRSIRQALRVARMARMAHMGATRSRTNAPYWLLPWRALAGNVSANALMYERRRLLLFDPPAWEVTHSRLASTLERWGAFFYEG